MCGIVVAVARHYTICGLVAVRLDSHIGARSRDNTD